MFFCLFWTLLAITFLALEACVPGLFFFLSFSVGSMAGGLASIYVPDPKIQIGLALFVSFASFILLKKLIDGQKLSRLEKKSSHTNIDALLGERATAVSKITPGTVGLVKLGGEVWSAQNSDIKNLEPGHDVMVIKIEGNKLIVKNLEIKND